MNVIFVYPTAGFFLSRHAKNFLDFWISALLNVRALKQPCIQAARNVQRKNLCSSDEMAVSTVTVHAGHSLGGGYSTTLLLHLLALKAKGDASLDRIQLEGAYTFGAPLTLFQAAGGQEASYNAAQKLLAGCR